MTKMLFNEPLVDVKIDIEVVGFGTGYCVTAKLVTVDDEPSTLYSTETQFFDRLDDLDAIAGGAAQKVVDWLSRRQDYIPESVSVDSTQATTEEDTHG